MEEYEHCVGIVMDYLTQKHYCTQLVNANRRCFKRLREYLESNKIEYSPEIADEWYVSVKEQISKKDRGFFNTALAKLQDAYESGEIGIEHDTRHLMSYSALCTDLKNGLEDYLDNLSTVLSSETVKNHKRGCSRFLIYIQDKGAANIGDITFDLIAEFYMDDTHTGDVSKHQINAQVSAMMAYFFKKGEVPYGFTTIIHYLSHGHNEGCYWNRVSNDTHEKISLLSQSSETVGTETLRRYKDLLEEIHRDNGYSNTMVTAYRSAAELLILFLEMNDYRYNPEISMLWFSDTKQFLGTQADIYRRSLCLIADFHKTGCFPIEKMYLERLSAFSQLPEWCREPADRYVDLKEKEGWAKSTLDMIRSSICRFCSYLDSAGIRSFRTLTAEHIKQFNTHDLHKTPQGKNAYNVRIRKFLIYLGMHDYLTNPMLFVSLTKVSAPRESVVVILTEEEMSELKSQLDDESGLSLRKKAMLLLGLKMGLRASDIVNLAIDDVNWDTASIRFMQKKTLVEVNLPMPAEVGNALFRYITEERHHNTDRKIFLSENAPHRPVGRAACTKALDSALPDRNVEGSGFHVTRKTYATGLLRKGVGASMVAEALGQRGVSSVHRYLSLDSERMRLCPMSLSDFEVGGWHHD